MKDNLLDMFAAVAKDMGYKVKEVGEHKTNNQEQPGNAEKVVEFSYGIKIKPGAIVRAAFSKDSLDMKKMLMNELEYDPVYFVRKLVEHLGVDGDRDSLIGACFYLTPKEWENIIKVKGDGTPSTFKVNTCLSDTFFSLTYCPYQSRGFFMLPVLLESCTFHKAHPVGFGTLVSEKWLKINCF